MDMGGRSGVPAGGQRLVNGRGPNIRGPTPRVLGDRLLPGRPAAGLCNLTRM